VQDIVHINGRKGIKIPMLHHIGEASKFTILCKLKLHTEEELQRAEEVIIGHHKQLKQIIFDRESAIIAIRDWLLITMKIRHKLSR
jgi:3-deoxy-D-arabino-heptulosonate 7-phosphate (DAHP) synthase